MTGRWAEGEEVEAALDVDGGGWRVGVVRWIAGPDSSVSNVPLRLVLPPAPRDVDPPIKRRSKIRSDSTFDKKKMMKSHTGAVLRVLLILRVEIMESVRHHVFRIDRFLCIYRHRLHHSSLLTRLDNKIPSNCSRYFAWWLCDHANRWRNFGRKPSLGKRSARPRQRNPFQCRPGRFQKKINGWRLQLTR